MIHHFPNLFLTFNLRENEKGAEKSEDEDERQDSAKCKRRCVFDNNWRPDQKVAEGHCCQKCKWRPEQQEFRKSFVEVKNLLLQSQMFLDKALDLSVLLCNLKFPVKT